MYKMYINFWTPVSSCIFLPSFFYSFPQGKTLEGKYINFKIHIYAYIFRFYVSRVYVHRNHCFSSVLPKPSRKWSEKSWQDTGKALKEEMEREKIKKKKKRKIKKMEKEKRKKENERKTI